MSTTKKQRLSDEILNDNSIEIALKVFETSVGEKLRSTEDQLRDATDRLEARIGEQALIVCLAENRAALSLDPRMLF